MVCGGQGIMCGRYSLFNEQDNVEIQNIIHQVNQKYPHQLIRTGEIFPTNTVPILLSKNKQLEPELSVWGFPKYQGSGVIINARAETAAEKRTFRDSLINRRCIIPSTGFYEWDHNNRKYLFRLVGKQVLYMAGIYQEYDSFRRYVILTTAANDSMKDIHNRMPVILLHDKIHLWISHTDAALQYLYCKMPELSRTG